MRSWVVMTCSLFDFLKAGLHSPKSELGLEGFIVGVIIPALLAFSLKEFIDFGFQVSVWNPEFVRGQI